MAKKPACHPTKKYFCKDLCKSCYSKAYNAAHSVRRARVDYKRKDFVKDTMNTWQTKLNDADTIVNIVHAVFGRALRGKTTEEYGA